MTYSVGSIDVCHGATNDLSQMFNATILNSDAMDETKVKMTKGFNSIG